MKDKVDKQIKRFLKSVSEYKAITLMRYIRKAIESKSLIKIK